MLRPFIHTTVLFPLPHIGFPYVVGPILDSTLIIRKYVVSLLKIMADISKMDNRYKRNSSTKLGALVSAIKLSFSSKGKEGKPPGDDHGLSPYTKHPEEGEEVE